MSMKGVCKPTKIEKEFLKEFRGDRKKCPFCGENLNKASLIKYKILKTCECKKCGKLILDTPIIW